MSYFPVAHTGFAISKKVRAQLGQVSVEMDKEEIYSKHSNLNFIKRMFHAAGVT